MQVITNTDEADVGKLKDGMVATFTVDAYPGETFRGIIQQVRLASSTVQNVVTYNAVINVPNPDLRLKPGMTANIKIVIDKLDNVLRIPNAAIRFRPTLTDSEMADAFKRAGEERFYGFYKNVANQIQVANLPSATARPAGAMGFGGGGQRPGGQQSVSQVNRGRRTPIWIIGDDKLVRPVIVRLGLTDGVQTEILEGKLNQGDKIILSAEIGKSSTATTNRAPGFGPPMGRGR